MTDRISFPQTDFADNLTSTPTPRHLNHSISGSPGLQEAATVPSLKFVEGFLAPEQQAYCVRRIDAAESEWRNDLSRRVQHYGWRYDYKARAITPDMHLGALPDWLANVAQKLYDETGLFDRELYPILAKAPYLERCQAAALHSSHNPSSYRVSGKATWRLQS